MIYFVILLSFVCFYIWGWEGIGNVKFMGGGFFYEIEEVIVEFFIVCV